LRDKGADLLTIGLGLSPLFAGGAAGKLVMGWVGAKLGVRPGHPHRSGDDAVDPRLLPLSLPLALILLPVVGLMLNGTCRCSTHRAEFVSPARRTHAFAIFYTGGFGGGRHRPAPPACWVMPSDCRSPWRRCPALPPRRCRWCGRCAGVPVG
jgi:MFS family permease